MDDIRQWFSHDIYPSIASKLNELKLIWNDLGVSSEEQIREMMVGAGNILIRLIDHKLETLAEERKRHLKDAQFYGCKAIDLSHMLGEDCKDPDENLKILPLVEYLKNQVHDLEKIHDERLTEKKKLYQIEQALCKQLGEKCVKVSNDLTRKALENLKDNVEELQQEKIKRLEVFRSTKERMVRLMNELEHVPDTDFVHGILYDNEESVVLTKVNLTAMRNLTEKFEKDVEHNMAKARSLRDSLQLLWNFLQVDGDVQRKFLDEHKGCQPSTIALLRKEVGRCQRLKMENAKQYVDRVREEINVLWDRCYCSSQQRMTFKPFYSEDITEEIMEAHDSELQRLRQFFAESEGIIAKFEKRGELWEKMLKFEKAANDPRRLANRGGRLLKEEKERKKLMAFIPKLETDLGTLVEKWKAEKGYEFCIRGQPVMELVQQQWETLQQEKENEKEERRAKARVMEGNVGSSSKRSLLATPSKENPSKHFKLTPLSCNTVVTHGMRTVLSSRPPKPTPKSTVLRKRKPVPRRIVGQQAKQDTTFRAMPSLGDTVVCQPGGSSTFLTASNLSTYSQFTNQMLPWSQEAPAQPLRSSPIQ